MAPLPAGVPGDSVVLGILHAALLTGHAHPMELPPDPLWPRQSRPGESGTDGTPAPRHSPFTFTALVNKEKPVYFPRISLLYIVYTYNSAGHHYKYRKQFLIRTVKLPPFILKVLFFFFFS